MKFKKMLCSVLLTIPLTASANVLAQQAGTAYFDIKLYNNIGLNKPLHFYVSIHGQPFVEGILLAGDDNGQSIPVIKKGAQPDAELTLEDTAGTTLWHGTVSYNEDGAEFYTKTMQLDTHYQLGTNVYPAAHTISFDIRNQAK